MSASLRTASSDMGGLAASPARGRQPSDSGRSRGGSAERCGSPDGALTPPGLPVPLELVTTSLLGAAALPPPSLLAFSQDAACEEQLGEGAPPPSPPGLSTPRAQFVPPECFRSPKGATGMSGLSAALVAHSPLAEPELEDRKRSRGSIYHKQGLCRPCQFMRNRKGCLDGADCVHCHYPHEEMTNSAIRRAHRRASAEKREPLKVGPERPMTRSESTTPGDVFSELFTPTTASERDQSEGSQEVDAQDSAGSETADELLPGPPNDPWKVPVPRGAAAGWALPPDRVAHLSIDVLRRWTTSAFACSM